MEEDWMDPEDFLDEADRLMEDGAYEDALKACQKALRLDAENADAHALSGRCLAYLNRVDEAEKELLKALDFDKGCVDAWFGLAFVSWLRADDREALGYLERARRLAPDDEAVLSQLIGIHGNLGAFDEAERLYKEAADLHPNSAELAYQWGLVLSKQGRQGDALAFWNKAAEWDEEYPDLHLAMARAYAQKGDFDQAERELRLELEIYPDSREARLALGGYYIQRGELTQAVKIYEELLKEVEDDSRIHLDLGIALVRLGRAARARKHLLRALELSPSDPLILSHLSTAVQSKTDMSRARRVLRRAIRDEPHRDDLYRNLSALFAGEGRFEEAEAELQHAMAFSGRAHELENDLGVLLAMQGKFDEAREAFERGLADRPEDLPLRINRALIEADLGRHEAALGLLQVLAGQYPDNLDVLGNQASVLLDLRRAEEAAGIARGVIERAAFDPRGYYLLGRAGYDLGRYDEAMKAFDRSLRLEPNQVDTLIALGLCHGALGRTKECVRSFEQARAIAPNDPDVLYNLGLAYEDTAAAAKDARAVHEAVALYRRVLELAPKYQGARERLDALADEGEGPGA